MKDDVNTVTELLRLRANVNVNGGPTFDSPLHLAVLYEFPMIVKALLENGANVSSQNLVSLYFSNVLTV
jgi:hypothetical protein